MGRASRGLSQKQLAKRAGLDASYLSLVESGRRSPSLKTLQSISDALDIPFYLLALMASEGDDLRGLSNAQAQRIARELLAVLADAEDDDG